MSYNCNIQEPHLLVLRWYQIQVKNQEFQSGNLPFRISLLLFAQFVDITSHVTFDYHVTRNTVTRDTRIFRVTPSTPSKS